MKSKDPEKILKEFFKDISPQTARAWASKGKLPEGFNLTRLRYFLEREGFAPEMLRALQPEVYKLGKLFAFGGASVKEIADALLYTGPTMQQQVLILLHGKCALVEKKMNGVHAFLAKKLQTSFQPTIRQIPELLSRNQEDGQPSTKELMLRLAADHIRSLTAVAEFLVSDKANEKDRSRLHEIAGENAVLALISRLRPLCSETALRRSTTL